MSGEGTVTSAEIARLANVGRAAVSNWRKRHPDFPEPVIGAGGGTSFRRAEVEQWLRKQGKLADATAADEVWRVLDAQPDALDLVADVAAYLVGQPGAVPPVEVRDLLDGLAGSERAELVESLCSRAFDRQQRQHLLTPSGLSHLMVALASPVNGTVFDPACGPGNLLHAVPDGNVLVGQEVDPTLARLAGARLRADVAVGDALRADAFPDLRADVVLCDPPFGYRDWGHEDLAVDPRWEYGFPVKGEPELAWVQHCLAHAKPGGTVVIALPAGVSGRRSGRVIRQALLRRGAVRAVVALPAGALMSTGIAVHLWILRNPSEQRANPVLLVDASHHQPPRRGLVDWPALEAAVLTAWQEFRDTGAVTEIPGRCRVVEPIDLLDEDVDLTPARHLPQAPVELDLAAVAVSRSRLSQLLGNLAEQLPPVRKATRMTRAMTTVGDLARAGAVTLLQQTAPLRTSESGNGPRLLTGRDVLTGQAPAERCADAETSAVLLRPGDVVVPLLAAGDGAVRPLVIEEEGLALGPNLQLLRVDQTRMDPHFLCGHLRGMKPRAVASTMSGVHRTDVRRVELPVLDLDRQRTVGDAFRRIAAFQAELNDAVGLGAELAAQLIDGLADGGVEPGE